MVDFRAMGNRLVFVVGNSRSGTTMLARMLGLHPDVHTFQELHFFEELWTPGDESRALTRDEALRLAGRLLHNARDWYHKPYDAEKYRTAATAIVKGMVLPLRAHQVFEAVVEQEAVAAGAAVGCEQTPRNVFYIDEIKRLFPEAQIVALVRDPLDVLLSQRNWWKRRSRGSGSIPLKTTVRQWVDYHPITTSLLWRGGVRAADAHAGEPSVHSLRFEDLVRDPRQTLAPVLDALGLLFDDRMLEVPRQSSSNAANRGGTGVDPSVSGRGVESLSAAEIWVSQKLTGTLARAHGYVLEPVSPRPWELAWCLLSWPLKMAAAFALNVGRTRNVVTSIRRRLAL